MEQQHPQYGDHTAARAAIFHHGRMSRWIRRKILPRIQSRFEQFQVLPKLRSPAPLAATVVPPRGLAAVAFARMAIRANQRFLALRRPCRSKEIRHDGRAIEQFGVRPLELGMPLATDHVTVAGPADGFDDAVAN